MIDISRIIELGKRDGYEELTIHVQTGCTEKDSLGAEIIVENEGTRLLQLEVKEDVMRESVQAYLEPIFGILPPYKDLLLEYYCFKGEKETLHVTESDKDTFRARKIFGESSFSVILDANLTGKGFFKTPETVSEVISHPSYLLSVNEDGSFSMTGVDDKTRLWGAI